MRRHGRVPLEQVSSAAIRAVLADTLSGSIAGRIGPRESPFPYGSDGPVGTLLTWQPDDPLCCPISVVVDVDDPPWVDVYVGRSDTSLEVGYEDQHHPEERQNYLSELAGIAKAVMDGNVAIYSQSAPRSRMVQTTVIGVHGSEPLVHTVHDSESDLPYRLTTYLSWPRG